jgi:hypothetical protein
VTEATRITGHATNAAHMAEGLSELARQFATRPRVRALLAALLRPVQEVEDEVWDLYGLAIADSSDDALDQLGVALGQARPAGLADAAYRSVLRAVVLTLHSSGTGNELLAVMREIVGSYDFTMEEAFPASLVFRPDAAGDVPAAVALEVLRRGASAGVRLQVVDVPDEDRFRFSSSSEEVVASSSNGFGDSTGVANGGALVGVVST